MVMADEGVLVELEAKKQEHFDRLHSKELMNIGKNFTSDEQIDVCKVVSSKVMKEELDRRLQLIDSILTALSDRMSQTSDNMDLIEKEELLADIRQIVRA